MKTILFKKTILLTGCLALMTLMARAQPPAAKHPFTSITEFGGLFGRVNYGNQFYQSIENRLSFTAQTFNGVQLRPRLAVGATVGVDWYAAALLMPVCAGVRYDLARNTQKNVRLFTSLDAGYGVAWLHQSVTNYSTTGGWVISPGVGLRIGRPGAASFTMSVGYKRQEARVDKPIDGFYTLVRSEDRVYNRMAVRLGIAF